MHLDIHKAKLILDVNGRKMKGKKKKKENIFKSRDFCNLKKKNFKPKLACGYLRAIC